MQKLTDAILKIAKKNPEGFTVRLPSLQKVTKHWVVAFKETQNSFDTRGLKKATDHALKNDHTIGGWHNELDGKFYFDSVRIFESEDAATKFGKSQGQLAIYEIHNNRLKFL